MFCMVFALCWIDLRNHNFTQSLNSNSTAKQVRIEAEKTITSKASFNVKSNDFYHTAEVPGPKVSFFSYAFHPFLSLLSLSHIHLRWPMKWILVILAKQEYIAGAMTIILITITVWMANKPPHDAYQLSLPQIISSFWQTYF